MSGFWHNPAAEALTIGINSMVLSLVSKSGIDIFLVHLIHVEMESSKRITYSISNFETTTS
jgi:hypothetical protein